MTAAPPIKEEQAPDADTPVRDHSRDDTLFRLHCLNRDCFAMSMMKYRNAQGYLVTGQHSGTHWSKWMLSHAIAHHYKVAPPKFFNNASMASNDIIGHPKLPQMHAHVPRVVTSHSIPPYAMQWKWLRTFMRFPPYALVVRDIRNVLVSNYEKWRERYNVEFSDYVAGDPRGDKYICDVWWYVRFMNRWGEVAKRFPDKVLVLRYEDFQADRILSLRRITQHFGLSLGEESLQAGADAGSKESMSKHHDPAVDAQALRPDGKGDAAFSAADNALLNSILDKNLKHDFGYKYFPDPRGYQVSKE